ncbi:hypothetical protein [Streptomyces noursei]|uniref:hypothetical protein n=1 Tax=Streptomyces noursei TaxID=1971 RepID=UPI001675187F|nr:hypothetical protein [Streptomyces noursei]MCZ1021316.1 hypothetical protein [Streptomyces noursei]GGX55793.1 hypothetical protein GCM10010341_90640 [Streptomyces noursei]
MTPAQLSLGGLALAAAVLVFTLIRWWRAGHQAPSAAAIAGGLLIGLLGALCSGGLLGWATRRLTTSVTNPLGNAGAGTGTSQLLPPAAPSGMTPGGGVATTLLLVVVLLAWRCCDNQLRRQIAAGALVGSATGLIGGASGLAAITLIPAVNHLGDHILASLPFQYS